MLLKKDYWIAIICKFGVIFTEMLITIFLNRGLGVSEKGEYSYVIKWVEILYVICSLGLGQVYATFRKGGKEFLRDAFIALGLIQSVMVLIIGALVSPVFNIENSVAITILSALATLKSIFTMIAVIERNITRNILQVGINFLYVCFLAILYFSGIFSLGVVLVCYGLIDFIRVIVLMGVYRLWPSMRHLSGIVLKNIYKLGFSTMILTLLVTLNYSLSTIMVRNLASSYAAGIYSVGASFSTIFLLIPDAFKDVLFGEASKKDLNNKSVFSVIKVSLLFAVAILMGWVLFGQLLISLLYGKEYLEAYQVTTILFIGDFSLIAFKILQPIFIADGKQNIANLFLILSAISSIIANIIFIPKLGYIGASISPAISYTICGGLFLLYYIKYTKKCER